MTVWIEWFGMAEAAADDGRGATTLIGLDQNVVQSDALPLNTKRVFALLLKEDEDPDPVLPGAKLAIHIAVDSPSGKTLVAATQPGNVGEKRFDSIPIGFRIFAEMGLTLEEYGTYKATCRVDLPDGSTLEASKNLYVIKPSA